MKRSFQLLAALADDHHAPLRAHRLDGREQVEQHWLARDRVEHLVRVGAHARALPRGEDDDREIRLIHGAAITRHAVLAGFSIEEGPGPREPGALRSGCRSRWRD